MVHTEQTAPGRSGAEDAPSPNSVAEVLSAAAALIEPDGCWTQGAASRDASGGMGAAANKAVCWCLFGAISRVAGVRTWLETDAFEAVRQVVGDAFIPWNDAPDRKQAEVVAALRKAADLVRGAS